MTAQTASHLPILQKCMSMLHLPPTTLLSSCTCFLHMRTSRLSSLSTGPLVWLVYVAHRGRQALLHGAATKHQSSSWETLMALEQNGSTSKFHWIDLRSPEVKVAHYPGASPRNQPNCVPPLPVPWSIRPLFLAWRCKATKSPESCQGRIFQPMT